jgi:hypothetical protein
MPFDPILLGGSLSNSQAKTQMFFELGANSETSGGKKEMLTGFFDLRTDAFTIPTLKGYENVSIILSVSFAMSINDSMANP